MRGKQFDGTAFERRGRTIDKYGKMLEEYGFERYGNELLYDGMTGSKFKARSSHGVVYYKGLPHGKQQDTGEEQRKGADTHAPADRGKQAGERSGSERWNVTR